MQPQRDSSAGPHGQGTGVAGRQQARAVLRADVEAGKDHGVQQLEGGGELRGHRACRDCENGLRVEL